MLCVNYVTSHQSCVTYIWRFRLIFVQIVEEIGFEALHKVYG